MKIGGNSIGYRTQPRGAARARVEKSKPASGLGERAARAPERGVTSWPQQTALQPSHSDTERREDLARNGPDPRFAAHVLGQIISPARPSPPLVARAYAETMRRQGPARLIQVL